MFDCYLDILLKDLNNDKEIEKLQLEDSWIKKNPSEQTLFKTNKTIIYNSIFVENVTKDLHIYLNDKLKNVCNLKYKLINDVYYPDIIWIVIV